MFKVYNWNQVRFWEDVWADSSSLATSFPDFFSFSSKKGLSIAEFWDTEASTWNLGLCRNLFDKELNSWVSFTENVEGVMLGQGRDRLWWKIDKSGVFSIESAFLALTSPSHRLESSSFNQIWHFKVPKKASPFSSFSFLLLYVYEWCRIFEPSFCSLLISI